MPTLHWLTRDEDIKAAGAAPYRLLEEDAKLGCGDKDAGNMLIQGDNLEALKALLPFYAGRVKCIFIDPPFNTGQAFSDYDDNLEHSLWLGIMFPRLELLRSFLTDDGSIFIHLDDNELDYAKVIGDEIFYRKNFVSRITLKARSPSAFSTVNPGVFKASEYLLWFCRDRSKLFQHRLWVPRPPDSAYNKFIPNISDEYKNWRIEPIAPLLNEVVKNARSPNSVQKLIKGFYVSHARKIIRFAEISDTGAGQDIVDVKVKSVERPGEIFHHARDNYSDVYIKNGQQLVFYEKNIKEIDGEMTPARMLTNIWDDISWEGIASEGGVRFPKSKKPERLIRRCLQLVTNPEDLVLDSFLGSGTTAAVAHKMGRRYIGIEMGDHAKNLCAARLEKVIGGEQGGISKAVNWRGGGGFRFYRLGPAVFDETGNIRANIGFPVLAAHIWFSETLAPLGGAPKTPFLGVYKGRAYALLYNGVLGDKRVNGGNVLTRAVLKIIRDEINKTAPDFHGPLIIYGERTALGRAALDRENILFKQTPYDVKARG